MEYAYDVPRMQARSALAFVATRRVRSEDEAGTVRQSSSQRVNLRPAVASGIIVVTAELARFASPGSEQLLLDDLAAGVVGFLDAQFVDTTVPAGTTSRASITNGVAVWLDGP